MSEKVESVEPSRAREDLPTVDEVIAWCEQEAADADCCGRTESSLYAEAAAAHLRALVALVRPRCLPDGHAVVQAAARR